jgi:hypothetical protein
MTISGAQLAALRAALAGDGHAFEGLVGESAIGFDEKFAVLTASAFVVAVRRRFREKWSIGDVIGFVGTLRARNEAEHADVDAGAAEHVLISALTGQPMRGEFGDLDKGYAQFALLAELVSDLDEGELRALLEEARDRADQWLRQGLR